MNKSDARRRPFASLPQRCAKQAPRDCLLHHAGSGGEQRDSRLEQRDSRLEQKSSTPLPNCRQAEPRDCTVQSRNAAPESRKCIRAPYGTTRGRERGQIENPLPCATTSSGSTSQLQRATAKRSLSTAKMNPGIVKPKPGSCALRNPFPKKFWASHKNQCGCGNPIKGARPPSTLRRKCCQVSLSVSFDFSP